MNNEWGVDTLTELEVPSNDDDMEKHIFYEPSLMTNDDADDSSSEMFEEWSTASSNNERT